jgi:hypothetical protein
MQAKVRLCRQPRGHRPWVSARQCEQARLLTRHPQPCRCRRRLVLTAPSGAGCEGRRHEGARPDSIGSERNGWAWPQIANPDSGGDGWAYRCGIERGLPRELGGSGRSPSSCAAPHHECTTSRADVEAFFSATCRVPTRPSQTDPERAARLSGPIGSGGADGLTWASPDRSLLSPAFVSH